MDSPAPHFDISDSRQHDVAWLMCSALVGAALMLGNHVDQAAVEEAQSSGAKVVYGDRDVDETVRRITRNFTFQDLMSLFVSVSVDCACQ